MSARPPRSSVLPQGAWEEKAKEHIGSKSALAPPSEGKRRAARASGAGFKRAGWAALDEEVKAPKASSRSKKSAGGAAIGFSTPRNGLVRGNGTRLFFLPFAWVFHDFHVFSWFS